jgi:hypothetical protein
MNYITVIQPSRGDGLAVRRELVAGAAPLPGPPSKMGSRTGIISSPEQAEPYPGTSGAARAYFDQPFGQTLTARRTRSSPEGARPRR